MLFRSGCGKLVCDNRSWTANKGEASPVAWTVDEQGKDYIRMSCEDEVEINRGRFAYRLVRDIALGPNGPAVSSHMKMDVPWAEPIIWFAHPFFRHEDGTGSRMAVPSEGICTLPVEANRVILKKEGGFGTITGVHGLRDSLDIALDSRLGGGHVSINNDWPIDKLVIYASAQVFSVEPYLARAGHTGEDIRWKIEYGFKTADSL